MWSLIPYNNQKIPLYQKIMLLIEEQIKIGNLPVGSPIPSERKLAELLEVNRSTVTRAFEELSDRGIIIRKKGSGSYVNTEKWGLQTQPIINWQPLFGVKTAIEKSPYQRKIDALKKSGKMQTYLDLSNGDLPTDLVPALKTPELSWGELIQKENEMTTNQLGILSLRQSVQRHLAKTYQMKVPLEEILITSGTQQGLFLIAQGLLKPGDTIGVEAPSYFYSLPLFQATGVRIVPLPIDKEGVMMGPLAEACLNYPIKMIFINPIFQNPTGSIMSFERKAALLEFCQLRRIPIVEDDVYGGLTFSTDEVTPLKKMDQKNQVIYLGSLSKYVGQHLRIGWMVAPQNIVTQLAHIRHQIDSGLSVLPQILADTFLVKDFVSQQARLKKELSKRAEYAEDWLTKRFSNKVQFDEVKGGYHLYARFPKLDVKAFNQLLDDLLEENIIVGEGQFFGDTVPAMRISFGHVVDKEVMA
ncbi:MULTISPECIES: aminotransferase-like domain-containing protein [Carnobacterium]|uniref:aminotransferase-like domain-containing protein n=1 Tax=Carnobacterium TaxID=2747 RepID=UPI00288FA1E8|nr:MULTISPECIES: PLP-dependent aminotransferase family protein [Carnobacterium]MDT1940313.1 PLP-dependent aminotransferase family protein [Carnobacterium divergens]MDT1942751.1 PLP-dependent aminotransferase family protein [Carnobacterium divergens]MDT1948557.1 PLP-dependent aminotransferase family protein [Carnobacterium divergens]MDT1951038.1 PLP-dependent aminotransferase family protein [Carnobacterium divergens]MDT1956096.1 PLP-dependent aminotransferase family protein [Carnobacterium dive